jgi:hypothetical protein
VSASASILLSSAGLLLYKFDRPSGQDGAEPRRTAPRLGLGVQGTNGGAGAVVVGSF